MVNNQDSGIFTHAALNIIAADISRMRDTQVAPVVNTMEKTPDPVKGLIGTTVIDYNNSIHKVRYSFYYLANIIFLIISRNDDGYNFSLEHEIWKTGL